LDFDIQSWTTTVQRDARPGEALHVIGARVIRQNNVVKNVMGQLIKRHL
jgi:hypothetical protein